MKNIKQSEIKLSIMHRLHSNLGGITGVVMGIVFVVFLEISPAWLLSRCIDKVQFLV